MVGGAGTGLYFYADYLLPTPPAKIMTLWWTNAPGAIVSDVWGRTNVTGLEYHIGTFTNQNWVHRTNIPAEFYRVSHPQMPGQYWDAPGVWRVNTNLLFGK